MIGRCRRQHVDGIADARRCGKKRAQLRPGGVAQRRKLQAVGLTRIGRQNARATGVREDRNARTSRYWLMREQRRDIEHLFQTFSADHPCLAEQRIDHDIVGRQRAGVGRCGPGSRHGPSGFHGNDRFLSAHTAGNLRELLRVPETLEIQQDDRRLRILGPVLNQVVAGHVRLVAHRHEAGDSNTQLLGIVENRQPECAALRRHRHVSARRVHRRERGVQLNVRIGIEEAHAVRADQATPCPPHRVDECRFTGAAGGIALAEAGADDADCADALHDAVIDSSKDLVCRNHDHRQIDGTGNITDAPICGQPGDLAGARVYRNDRSGESCGPKVVENLRSDLAARPVRTDDSHHARLEERPHRCDRGDLRSHGHLLGERIGHCKRQRDTACPAREPNRFGETGMSKDIQHLAVHGEDVGIKRVDTRLSGNPGELLEQTRPDAMTLNGVGHSKGHLRSMRISGLRIVAGEGEDASTGLGDESGRAPIDADERTNIRHG